MVALATAFVRIRADASGFKRDADAQLGKSADELGKKHGHGFGTAFSSAAKTALGGIFAAGAAVFGKAIIDARALGLGPLKVAVKDAGIAWAKFTPQLDTAQVSLEKLGFTNAEVNSAMKNLITITRSQSVSFKSLGTVADFARYKSISLSDAALTLGKAAAGNTRALRDVGISASALPKHFAKAGTEASRMALIMKLLNERIGGQAAAASKTLGGKIGVLKATFTDMSAKLGVVLIPVLSKLVTVLSAVVTPLLKNKAAFAALGIGLIIFAATAKVAMALFATSVKAALVTSVVGIAILALTLALTYLLIHWKTVWGTAKRVFLDVTRVISGAVTVFIDWIKSHWRLLLSILTGPIGAATIAIIGNWHAIVAGAVGAFNAVVGFIKAIPGRILGAIGSLGKLLWNTGIDVIRGLLGGITAALANIGSFVKHYIFDPIVGGIKSLFGIHSPSTVMMGIGGHLISGLIRGLIKANPAAVIGRVFGGLPQALGALVGKGLVTLEQLPGKAISALGKVGGFFKHLFGFGGGGGGVGQWRGVVNAALGMLHEPLSLANQVLYQMGTESGGNPRAINLTDINAQMGDPSKGLLQVIGSTFRTYGNPNLSHDPYDPLANVFAAINYAIHRYGPSLMSGGFGLGSGHGYALGGLIREPIVGVGRSGRRYTFGEKGSETVIPGDVGAALNAISGKLDALNDLTAEVIGHLAAAPAATGAATAGALNGSVRAGAYQRYYGVS